MAPRIIQLTPTITPGDAVSNDVLAMREVLTELGSDNAIYCIGMAEKFRRIAKPFHSYRPRPDDILLYHMSIGSEMSSFVRDVAVMRKLMVYHNITPPEFFDGFPTLQRGCRQGRRELEELAPVIDFAFADSDYNRTELEALGYRSTKTLPIIFDKTEYMETKVTAAVMEDMRKDGFVNILFVGRFAPNKKQEDVIRSFHLYNSHINPKSRLILIGNDSGTESYRYSLGEYIRELGVKNVVLPGHVPFADILAYYRSADLFLCMSEHEGFCVPLIEAMVFDLPIIAFASTAIPDTLGTSGVLMQEKNHALIAETMHELITNPMLRTAVVEGQRNRLRHFDAARTKESFRAYILPFLGKQAR